MLSVKRFYKLLILTLIFCSCRNSSFGQKNLFVSGELFGKYFIPGINVGKYYQKDSSKVFFNYSIGGWYNPGKILSRIYGNRLEINAGVAVNYRLKRSIVGIEIGASRYLYRNFATTKSYFNYTPKELYYDMSAPFFSLNFNFSLLKYRSIIYKIGSLVEPFYRYSKWNYEPRPMVGIEYRFINKNKYK